MPFPALLLWGAAAVVTAAVAKAGIEVYNEREEAKETVNYVVGRYNAAMTSLKEAITQSREEIKDLDSIKVNAFQHQIKYVVDAISARAKLAGGNRKCHSKLSIKESIVDAPELGVDDFVMPDSSEEAVKKAHSYASKIDKAIEDIDALQANLSALVDKKNKLAQIIRELVYTFESCKVDASASELDFNKMIIIGKTLKKALDVPCRIIDDESKFPNATSVISLGASLELALEA